MKIKIKTADESIHPKHLLLSPELLGELFIQVNVRVIVGSTSSSIKAIALSICSAKWLLNNYCFYSNYAHRIIEFYFFQSYFKLVQIQYGRIFPPTPKLWQLRGWDIFIKPQKRRKYFLKAWLANISFYMSIYLCTE